MRKVLTATFVACLLLAPYAHAARRTYGEVAAVVTNVYDGDTLTVEIPTWPDVVGKSIGVRVYGIDTREMKGRLNPGGGSAKSWVQKRLPVGSTVTLTNIRRDKYFRLLADVQYNCEMKCESLADGLLEAGLAVRYFGGSKHGLWETPTNSSLVEPVPNKK